MRLAQPVRAFWWLVAKDLTAEMRGGRAWAGMLLLGVLLVLLVEMQMELPPEQKRQVVSGMLWLDVFFAGILALDRSFAAEREDGCWRALLLYPVSPAVIYFAKVAVNAVALLLLECVLVPAFAVFANVSLLERPVALAAVALLANVGFAAVGVVVCALTTSVSQRGSLLALLLLPLATPVLLGAAEATRLAQSGDLGDSWWRWLQMLAAFAVLFTTLGALLFEFVLED